MSPEARKAKGDELIRREKYLNNSKPAMIQSRKMNQNINAGKNRIAALKEEQAYLKQELAKLMGVRPAYQPVMAA